MLRCFSCSDLTLKQPVRGYRGRTVRVGVDMDERSCRVCAKTECQRRPLQEVTAEATEAEQAAMLQIGVN
ncbi:hypothetical protein AXF42_Ash021000 [Apostasia shenzhenica]|uniref:Uncharacterized protein n=1 Tax=Apostasia shenzhenica TaxID=1088818 RepID=A0A2I0AEV8_9ASPA|nr:hypothetical protein AXF42_Ash021000 [Apostasia shenzhenica]